MMTILGKGRTLRGIALLALVALASCEATTGRPPLQQAALEEGAVVVGGPGGYCIDPVTLERRAGRGFAVLASCQILSKPEICIRPTANAPTKNHKPASFMNP